MTYIGFICLIYVMMIENYAKYLEFITNKINGFFEKQKPYIFCRKGCSLCCEKGEYPWSEIEYKYIMEGFLKLSLELQNKIKENIKKNKEDKKNFKEDGVFMYQCPFLIDKSCVLYEYRGIICRSFGLLVSREDNKKPQIPFCSSLGLNYSNVYDKEKKIISGEMWKETGIEEEPKLFNVSYNFLTNESFAKGFKFQFGDKKPLIDWFEET